MKHAKYIILILILFIATLTGCDSENKSNTNESNDKNQKLSIVTTIFPQYDFTRQIIGDKADLKMLLSPGSESHSFEPTPQDIITIQSCDIFIYVGGENDEWAKRILDSIDTRNIKIISLIDCVNPLAEEVKAGMESEHQASNKETKDKSNTAEYDEHVWTSPQNAILITNAICDVLCSVDNTNSSVYRSNAEKYVSQLKQLDNQFKDVVYASKCKTIIFGDRFPLRYFTKEYGLDYWAAFPGCSSETEPSAATISFLIKKVNEEKIPVVFKIELSNGNIAESIAESTNTKVLTFNSCHNLSKDDFEKGVTYLELMNRNLDALKEALN